MTITTCAKYFGALLWLLLPLVAAAQTSPPPANTALTCVGFDYVDTRYTPAMVNIIQSNLRDIYQRDPVWQSNAAQPGHPLSDNLMGPITRSWIKRFCNDFQLQQSSELIKEFPDQSKRIANFANAWPAESDLLISAGFLNWHNSQPDTLRTQIPIVLYKGTDAELLALLKKYTSAAAPLVIREESAAEPELLTSKEPALKNHLYFYSLTADDFAKLKKTNNLADDLVVFGKKTFTSQDDFNLALTALLKDQTDVVQQSLRPTLKQRLQERVQFQFTTTNLEALANASLTAVQIEQLNALPKDIYTDEAVFTKLVRGALNKANSHSAALSSQQNAALPSNSSASASAPLPATSAGPASAKAAESADITLAVIRIVNATKTTRLVLVPADMDDVIQQLQQALTNRHLPARLVDLFRDLEDIKYPDGDLLHYAVQHKIVIGLGGCDRNKTLSSTATTAELSDADKQALEQELLAHAHDPALQNAIRSVFSLNTHSEQKSGCNDAWYSDLSMVYEKLIRPVIEQYYRKDAPAYTGVNPRWSGRACGCIPAEIESTAYGIFPYWNASDKVQDYDFSTLSRTGYYGVSFNADGKLTHTNTANQTNTLLDDDSAHANAFLNAARTYGSKVDWVIEKDWQDELTGDPQKDIQTLTLTLAALQDSIVELITRPLTDSMSRLKSTLSLGLIEHPTKGDGVTFYFKNYPKDADAKALFDKFFKSVKTELNKDKKNNKTTGNISNGYFVNIIVSQDEFTNSASVFGMANLDYLAGMTDDKIENMTPLEMQGKTRTLILILLKDPYYNSLAKLHEMTSIKTRQIILPVMFIDYKNFDPASKNVNDERRKGLSFIQEGFGGGGFWPMPQWDQEGVESFNRHVATLFALGYPQSWWAEKLCGYRWIIIAVMNIWLLLALLFITVTLYVFPHRCKTLPGHLDLLLRPLPLALLVLPPVLVWLYLLLMDNQFPLISISGFLCLVLCALMLHSAYVHVHELKQRKPNRNVLLAQKPRSKLPVRKRLTDETTPDDESPPA